MKDTQKDSRDNRTSAKELESVVSQIQDVQKCSPETALLILAQGMALSWEARREGEQGDMTPRLLTRLLEKAEFSEYDFLFERADEGLPRIWLTPTLNRQLNKMGSLFADSMQFAPVFETIVSVIGRSCVDLSSADEVILSSMCRLLRLDPNDSVVVAAADLGDCLMAFLRNYPQHSCQAFTWTPVSRQIAKFRLVLGGSGANVSLAGGFLSRDVRKVGQRDAVCLLPRWGGCVADASPDVHSIGSGWMSSEIRSVVRALEYLKPNGKLVALLPERLLDRSEFQPFKEYMLRTTDLGALVSVPVEMTSRRWRSNPCCLVAVRKKAVPAADFEQSALSFTVEGRTEDSFREMEDAVGAW